MASFAWSPDQDLFERYRDVDIEGLDAWRLFGEALLGEGYRQAFSDLLLRLQALVGRTMKNPRVFVSHRQADEEYAKRIAWLASQNAGLDYWLDVHDPLLRLAGVVLTPSDPRYPFVIAAIIEMALLNCTHVIAAHTPSSAGSRWIPYELGRAKSRKVVSRQMAGWFWGVRPKDCGEYVLLADITGSEPDVDSWLAAHAPRPIKPKPYPGPEPAALP